ncbi:MAG: hypothetical protein K1X86_15520 [Ignavibacteria bacterium]|nr:hypothetical protein [Ignavibacteria bacterium]
MIDFQKTIQIENLISKLAEALEYNVINSGECLMVHRNSGDFAKVEASKISGRKNQGWIECVCADTLESLLGLVETSDDGIKEATVIANWMREQN